MSQDLNFLQCHAFMFPNIAYPSERVDSMVKSPGKFEEQGSGSTNGPITEQVSTLHVYISRT